MNRLPLYLGLTVLLAARAWGDTKPATGATGAAGAAAPTTIPAVAAGAKTVTIDATGSDVRDVVKSMATQTGARILIGPEVTGKVASKLQDMPLESALSVVAKVTGNRWSKITIPAARVDSLTPEQAANLVLAADTLSAVAVEVRTSGAPVVVVGPAVASGSLAANGLSAPPSPEDPKLATIYVFLTKTDPATIRAAREAARTRTATKDEQAQLNAVAQKLGEDARKDPNVVKAYSALQALGPDQVAVLAREFIVNSTPDMRQAIGEALRNQRLEVRERIEQQQQQQ